MCVRCFYWKKLLVFKPGGMFLRDRNQLGE